MNAHTDLTEDPGELDLAYRKALVALWIIDTSSDMDAEDPTPEQGEEQPF